MTTTHNQTLLYQAMDWLLPQQARTEGALAKRHLAEGTLVLYDLTSTYFNGRHCPLAKFGHSRDEKKGRLQIVVGLMTNAEGRRWRRPSDPARNPSASNRRG